MSHLGFPHTEHLTQQKKEAALKLLMKNGSWPKLTFGSCKGIVWEAANSHRPKLYWGACYWSYSMDGYTSAPLLWACPGNIAILVEM